MSFIEIEIDNYIKKWAKQRLKGFKEDKKRRPNQYGHDKKRTEVGYIGQGLVLKYLDISFDSLETFNYDTPWNYKTWEVKTISTGYYPKLDWEATVNNSYKNKDKQQMFERRQKSDYYIFVRTLYDKSKGWIVGYLENLEFWRLGVFKPKGSQMTDNPNCGNLERADAVMVKINQLKDFKEYHENIINSTWLKGKNIL